MANWVSDLIINHVVWLGDYHFVGCLLVEALSFQSFQTVFCSSRRQYRDYIIHLYGVKISQ